MSFLQPYIIPRSAGFLKQNIRNIAFNRALRQSPSSDRFFQSVEGRVQGYHSAEKNTAQTQANAKASAEAQKALQPQLEATLREEKRLHALYDAAQADWVAGIQDKITRNLSSPNNPPAIQTEVATLAGNTAHELLNQGTTPTAVHIAITEALNKWQPSSQYIGIRARNRVVRQALHELQPVIAGEKWGEILRIDQPYQAVCAMAKELDNTLLLAKQGQIQAKNVSGARVELSNSGKSQWQPNPNFSWSWNNFWRILPQRTIRAGSEFFKAKMQHGKGSVTFQTVERGFAQEKASDTKVDLLVPRSGTHYAEEQIPLLGRFFNLLGRIRDPRKLNTRMHPSVALKGSKTLTANGMQHAEQMADALEDEAIKAQMTALEKRTPNGTLYEYTELIGRRKPAEKDRLRIHSDHHSFFHPGGAPLIGDARIKVEEGATHDARVDSVRRGLKYVEGLAPAKRANVSPQIRLQDDIATERAETIADTIDEVIFQDAKPNVDALAAHGNGKVSMKAKKGSYSSAGGKASTQLRVRQEGDKNRYGFQKTRYVRLNTQKADLSELEPSAARALSYAENAASRNPNISPNTMLVSSGHNKGQVAEHGAQRYSAFETAFDSNRGAINQLQAKGVRLRALDANTVRVEAPHRWGVVGSIFNPKHIFTRNASFNKVVDSSSTFNANNLVEAAIAKGKRLTGSPSR